VRETEPLYKLQSHQWFLKKHHEKQKKGLHKEKVLHMNKYKWKMIGHTHMKGEK